MGITLISIAVLILYLILSKKLRKKPLPSTYASSIDEEPSSGEWHAENGFLAPPSTEPDTSALSPTLPSAQGPSTALSPEEELQKGKEEVLQMLEQLQKERQESKGDEQA